MGKDGPDRQHCRCQNFLFSFLTVLCGIYINDTKCVIQLTVFIHNQGDCKYTSYAIFIDFAFRPKKRIYLTRCPRKSGRFGCSERQKSMFCATHCMNTIQTRPESSRFSLLHSIFIEIVFGNLIEIFINFDKKRGGFSQVVRGQAQGTNRKRRRKRGDLMPAGKKWFY